MTFFEPMQTGSENQPFSCTIGTGSFLGEEGWVLASTTHHLLEPRWHLLKNIPLPSLCASVARYKINLTLHKYQ